MNVLDLESLYRQHKIKIYIIFSLGLFLFVPGFYLLSEFSQSHYQGVGKILLGVGALLIFVSVISSLLYHAKKRQLESAGQNLQSALDGHGYSGNRHESIISEQTYVWNANEARWINEISVSPWSSDSKSQTNPAFSDDLPKFEPPPSYEEAIKVNECGASNNNIPKIFKGNKQKSKS